jgi:hypothetical protein
MRPGLLTQIAVIAFVLLASPVTVSGITACHLPVRHHPTIRTHAVHPIVFRGGFACPVEPQVCDANPCGAGEALFWHRSTERLRGTCGRPVARNLQASLDAIEPSVEVVHAP